MSDTPNDLPTRVAVLEQIAKDTQLALVDLRTEVRQGFADLRAEMRQMRTEARTDYRWLLGLMIGMTGGLLAVMAHGFHWL